MSDSASCSPTRRRKRVGRGAEGKRGVRRAGDERRSRGYFDELLRTYCMWDPRLRVVARPAISFVRQVMTKEREFLGRIALSERHFGTSFTYMRCETYLTIAANNRARSLKAKNQGMNVVIVIQTFESK